MVDSTVLVALVVAAVALLIALTQLAQQLLATAYVMHKCDSTVTGTLTNGGTRQWHWRQFRFTAKYQSVVFTLPSCVYRPMGIHSTICINHQTTGITWSRARETRLQQTSTQASRVLLLRDLVAVGCLRPDYICTWEEVGDRIPDDLTVAPIKVDCMTILLCSIALGMQVFRYSPTAGEIVLGGRTGSISSSKHPVLGCLLHYNVFPHVFNERREIIFIARNAQLLAHGDIWANGVFGRFHDRSHKPIGPEAVSLWTLMNRNMPLLRRYGCSDGLAIGDVDSGAGAACFMALGHVDVQEIAPPSVARDFAPHFAEVIVKAHCADVLRLRCDLRFNSELRSSDDGGSWPFNMKESVYISRDKCSSPYIQPIQPPWPIFYEGMVSGDLKASRIFPHRSLFGSSEPMAEDSWRHFCSERIDPSYLFTPDSLWDMLQIVDSCIFWVCHEVPPLYLEEFRVCSDQITAGSIRTLSQVGPPSWGNASTAVAKWPETIASFHEETMRDVEKICANSEHLVIIRRSLRVHAELSALRSACYTIMMRTARPLGPGLTIDSKIETALAYMV